MKKNLLYIGLSSHRKTRSTVFLQELLGTKYEVERLDVDAPMESFDDTRISALKTRKFDVLVIFQVWLDLTTLRRQISFRHGVWCPMFDGLPEDGHPFFDEISDFNIISFSFFVHEKLLRLGYASHYVQYFPKPPDAPVFGEPDTVYLWQRWTLLGLDTVARLFHGRPLKKVHVHNVPDPGNSFTGIPAELADRVEVSTWYDTREEMQADQRKYACYVAPRYFEGIGMGFLEAMAAGKCVIAADYPTANEYIVDGVNGLLFNDRDVHPIREGISFLEMQRNAYETCRVGYRKWLARRWRILEWCEASVAARRIDWSPTEMRGMSTKDAVRLVMWRAARKLFHLFPHPVRLFMNRICGRVR